jgi:ribosomal protein S3AE
LLSVLVQNEIRLLSESIIEKMVKKMTAENIFTIDTSKKVSTELKKQTKSIYPLNDAIIWKASIVQ